MKIKILTIGKTKDEYIKEGFLKYQKRIQKYTKLEIREWHGIRQKLPPEKLKIQEGKWIVKNTNPKDLLILLDEKGKQYTSVQFAKEMEKWPFLTSSDIILAIGGAYGFSQEVYNRSQSMLSLSKMTFSHQMVRLFLLEQIYRGYSILNGEPYHNV